MGQALAFHIRRCDRCPSRHRHSRMGKPIARQGRYRRISRSLQPLCAFSSENGVGDRWWRNCGCRRRILNGVLGGITGLAGTLVTVWCGLRGWPKDRQRTIFQPVAVAIFLMSAAWLGIKGVVSADTIRLFLLGLPALLA